MTVLRHMLRDELLSSSDITMLSGFIQLRGMLIFYLAFLRHVSHCSPMTFFYLSKLLFTLFLSLSSFKMWTAEKTLGLSESFLSTPLSMAVKCSFVWTHNRSQNPCQNMLRIPFRTQHFLYRARQIRSSKSLKDSCPPLYYIKRTTV